MIPSSEPFRSTVDALAAVVDDQAASGMVAPPTS
jgi:hypothetical protein